MEKLTQILVVDDDVDLASNLKDILVDEGYTVSIARSGKAAISLCREQQFPLVISDLKLPDISGVNLVNQLAEMMPDMESIIITGYASLDTALNAVGHKHIIAYKTKPVDIGDLLSFIKQVFERKRAEEALKESEERFREMFEHHQAVMILVEPDTGIIVDANQSAAEFYGYTREALCRMNIAEINTLPPDQVAMERQKAAKREVNQFIFPHRLASGEIRTVESHASPINVRGQLLLFSIIHDITRRKQAEERILLRNLELICLNEIATILSQSNDLDRALNNALAKIIGILDMDLGVVGVIDAHNKWIIKTHIGFSPQFLEVIADVKISEGFGERVVKSGKSFFVEDMLRDPRVARKDFVESEGLKSCIGVPLKTADKLFGVLYVISKKSKPASSSDIQLLETMGSQLGMAIENAQLSEQASRVKTLEEIDRLRSELFANVSHELRTPLTTIKGYSTLMRDYWRKLTAKEKRQYLEIIDKSVNRQVELIEQLLDMTRLETGTFRLKKTFTNIPELLGNAVAEAQVRAPNHKIILAPLERLPEVKIDRERILQVINNILDNAVKYSDEGTKVVVSAKQEEKGLLFSFTDEGMGIPAKDLERVFDRLFRANQRKKPQIGGVGLGLAICKGLVEAHKGRIWIESEEGKGSTCYFTLPLETEGDDPGEK